jgi:hypothetical protein
MNNIDRLKQGIIKANNSKDFKSVKTLGAELRRLQALDTGGDERTMYGADKFNESENRTTGQPSQMQLNEGDGNFQGSFGGSMLQGAEDVALGGTQMLYNASPKFMQEGRDKVNNYLSDATGGAVRKMPETGGFDQYVRDDEKMFQDARTRAGRSGFDAGRLFGNVLATAPLLAAKPFQMVNAGKDVFNAANIGRSVAQGGTYGLSQPVYQGDYWNEKKNQFGVGGAGGAGGALLGNMVSRVVKPNTRGSVTRLQEQGVTPTPGGILGGGWQVFEDKATSLPIVGTAINAAKKKAQEELNRAAYKRALTGTGIDASKLPVGPEGILKLKETLANAYKDIWANVNFKKEL